MTREICKICFHPNRVGFSVPDEVWNIVIPDIHKNHVVCLQCFTRLADEHLVEWDKNIEFFPISLQTFQFTDLPKPLKYSEME